jgi:lysophospholipase L1-like esterase
MLEPFTVSPDNHDVADVVWNRYVALGDAITEGLYDPAPRQPGSPVDNWQGWAQRLAVILDGHAQLAGQRLEFANLAARGRRIRHVVDDQVPKATALRADLASVLIGSGDLMAPRADPDSLAKQLESGIRALRRNGTHVVLAGCFDPQFAFFLKPFRGRAAVFNANLWSIARGTGCTVLDLWAMREFQHPAMWAADRINLSPRGHRFLAARAAHALGVPYAETESTSAHAVFRPAAPLPLHS